MINYSTTSLSLFLVLTILGPFHRSWAGEGVKKLAVIPEIIEVTETPKTPWIIDRPGHYLAKNILTLKSVNGSAIIIRAHNVTLEGFEVEASKGIAVVVDQSKRLILKKTVIKNSLVALELRDAQISLQAVTISSTDHLIWSVGSNNVKMSQSQFYGPFTEVYSVNDSSYIEINDSVFDLMGGAGLEINDQAVVSFRNTTLQDCGDQNCIKINDDARVHLVSSTINGAQAVGLMASGNSQTILQEVKMIGAKVGVLTSEQSRIVIKNSRIEEAQDIAILAINKSGLRLENNRFDSGIVGLKLKDEATAIVNENDFVNFKGVAISINEKSSINGALNQISRNQGTGMLIRTSGEVMWAHNYHQLNLLQGLEILDMQKGNLSSNVFSENSGDGLYIEKITSASMINGNIIERNNGCNVELPRYIVSNIVAANTIEDNTQKICLLPPSDEH